MPDPFTRILVRSYQYMRVSSNRGTPKSFEFIRSFPNKKHPAIEIRPMASVLLDASSQGGDEFHHPKKQLRRGTPGWAPVLFFFAWTDWEMTIMGENSYDVKFPLG